MGAHPTNQDAKFRPDLPMKLEGRHNSIRRALVLWLAAGLGVGLLAERIGIADEAALFGVVGCGIGAGLCALRIPITGQLALESAYLPVIGLPLSWVFC